MKWFILFSLILLFVASCAITSEKNTCCQQCLDAASQDPSGYDIAIKECASYDLSKDCANYFEKNEMTVGECREIVK